MHFIHQVSQENLVKYAGTRVFLPYVYEYNCDDYSYTQGIYNTGVEYLIKRELCKFKKNTKNIILSGQK